MQHKKSKFIYEKLSKITTYKSILKLTRKKRESYFTEPVYHYALFKWFLIPMNLRTKRFTEFYVNGYHFFKIELLRFETETN